MSDGKVNKDLHDAVRSGLSGAGRWIRSTLKNMRIWQKAGLVLCVVFWIASLILGSVCRRITGSLKDQNAASRWSRNGDFAQISCFLAEGSGASEDTVKAMYTGLMLDLQEAAIGLSDTQIENGASLINECFCGMGSADLSVGEESVTVNAIGVGGDFFNFHPLDLIDGYYFSEDDLMQDRILIDDQTAWRLFGSPNVVGMSVTIGGTPHFIAGVFRQPRERFYKESGMGSYLMYMSYDSLCKYTDSENAGGDGSGDPDDGGQDDQLGAQVPEGVPAAGQKAFDPSGDKSADPSIPHTAAYMPVISEDLPGKKGTLSDTIGDTGVGDNDSGETITETVSGDSDKDEDTVNDDPVRENLGNQGSSGQGYGKNRGEEEEESEEVDRSRVTCYEAVMPNPVQGFALARVRSRLEQTPFPMEKAVVVDNTSRFNVLRLITMLAQPGVRSMQIAPIRYPYWENVALAWEDVMIPYALLWMILRYSPLAFLLWLLIWYATHKSWTVGGIVRTIQDKIYDRQSERIYGKSTDAALPDSGLAAGGREGLPDKSAAEAEDLPDKSAAEVQDLPDKSAAEAEDLPDKSAAEVQDLPDKSAAEAQDLPEKDASDVKSLPDNEISSLENLPETDSAGKE